MKAKLHVAVWLIAVAALTGCETPDPQPAVQAGTTGEVATWWATTVDGRRIPCVSWITGRVSGTFAGGISCDWSAK